MEKTPITLREVTTGKDVEATLCDDLTEEHLQLWEAGWDKAMKAHCKGLPDDAKPEDWHWSWRDIANYYRSNPRCNLFAIEGDGEIQGMMVTEVAEDMDGQPLIYVGWLATAPWNRPEVLRQPGFKGVGRAMVAAAVKLSRDKGFDGRISLHSLPAAEQFYRDCGMDNKGFDEVKGMEYFEMTKERADKFCPKPTTP